MGIELGRISGPLLAENLLRNGVDLAFEDNLLYLDVTNNRIGIRKDNPSYTVDITGTTDTTALIVDTSTNVGTNLVFNTNLIQNISGAINIVPDQTTDPVITSTQFGTLNLRISDQLIENITNGSNINLSPNGLGQVIFNTTKVNVDGDLHATGDITWDGSITFGDSNTDNIAITSLINSDLIPKTHLTYDLGSVTNKWKEANLENLTATSISTNGITAFGINITLRVGNTWYVSKNGLDTNYGDHLHATFLTVKKALLVAEPGDEVIIFPGVYEEIFPLTVPEGVTVHGDSIRAVSITPTALTKSNDAFLLNSGATVENITVKDYYYNTLADTGYAFKIASGYLFNGKSPYVRNVSVITKTVGLDIAGRGALVDGSVVNTASTEASMLFHSVTFITPGAKALVLTNGVRVEWLNSFTYFASVGTELTNGTLGRAGLGIKFGGELRSINSANVYGDYGVTANGASTLAYLIGHNFGYIGSGLDSTNDPRNVIPANEVFESNNGKIYYESVDNKGDVRIGNIFYVSQETGQISFDASAINFGSNGSIALEGPTSATFIRAEYVQTGNIRLHDNTVESLGGPVNLTAQSGSTYLNTNVFVTGNLAITDNVIVKGNVYLGDTPLDLITVTPDLTQDINPDVTDSFTLGTDSKRWNNLFIKLVNVDNVTEVTNNAITTLTTDTDLKFVAAGLGEIHVATTNVQVDNDLTTGTGTAALATLDPLATVTAGTFNTGNVTISGHTITTTVADSDLDLSATGIVSIPLNPVKIDQNLTVTDLTTLTNVNVGRVLTTQVNQNLSGTSSATGFFFYGWQILNPGQTVPTFSVIQPGWTVVGQPTWIVTVVGDGVTNYDITISGGLFASGGTYSFTGPMPADVTLIGNYTQTGDRTIYGDVDISSNVTFLGVAQFNDFNINTNTLSTTTVDGDLKLGANGLGIVNVQTTNVLVNNDLTVSLNISTGSLTTVLGTTTAGTFTTGDITISDNTINTTVTNSNLLLKASTGNIVSIPTNDVDLSQKLTVTGKTTVTDVNIGTALAPKLLQQIGSYTQTGNKLITGDYQVTSNATFTGEAQFYNINVNTNVISTTLTDTDLRLQANGSGIIQVKTTDVQIDNDLTVDTNLTVNGTTSLKNTEIGEIVPFGTLLHTLNNPNASLAADFDNFGTAVAVSGNYAIVGVYSEHGIGGRSDPFSGYAYIYNVTTGALVHTLANPNSFGLARFDNFGWSVAISDNYTIVGAPGEGDAGDPNDSGKAYIFNVTTGALVHTLTNPTAYSTSVNDEFGNSVAISGNYAIVGAFQEDDAGGSTSGKAYIYNVTTGALVHTLNNPNAYSTSAADQFGLSVAISGNYAIVGASVEDDAGGTSSGKAYIYNATTGALVHTLNNPNAYGTSEFDVFGTSVAISGNYTIVGARGEGDAGGTSSGKAYIFNVTTGALVHTLNNPNAYGTSVSDQFGESVAISGDYAIVGVTEEDDAGGTSSGKAYIYNVTTGALVHTLNNPNAYSTSAGDRFGESVAISGNYAIAGAPGEDEAGASPAPGKAYIFSELLNPNTLTLVGNLDQTGDTYITGLFANNNISIVGSSYLTTSDIKIYSNEISVLSTNNDLNLVGATTGGVVVENQLKILDNVISNVRAGATTDVQKSILLSPNGTGNTVINSTKSLVLPVGNNSTRSMNTGEIRFNNLTSLYEGAISTGLVSFFNIYDSDRNTYITPELTLGANDNTIRFGINGTVRGTITSTALVTSTYNIDNVSITSNTLSNVSTSTDLNIATTGTGRILINSLPVKDSTITNTTNSALVLESTSTSSGGGYVKFGGTGAVVFPYGPTEDRRTLPELGETRYNSTLEYLEVFDGTAWLSAAGGGAGATLGYIEETLNLWSIVLG